MRLFLFIFCTCCFADSWGEKFIDKLKKSAGLDYVFYKSYLLKLGDGYQEKIESFEKEQEKKYKNLNEELNQKCIPKGVIFPEIYEKTIIPNFDISSDSSYDYIRKIIEINNKLIPEDKRLSIVNELPKGHFEKLDQPVEDEQISKKQIEGGMSLIDLVIVSKLLNSKSEVRRTIKNRGIKINNEIVSN